MEHIHCIMFYFFHECPLGGGQVSDPGGDDSSSGGGSDLGTAQNSLESDFHLMKRRALGDEWT